MTRYFLVRTAILLTIIFAVPTMQLHAETVIDFRKGADLKTLFDGGLRPWRTPGLDRTHLEVGACNIVLILATGEKLRIAVENGTFTILEGNRLAACELFGQQTSVEDSCRADEKYLRLAVSAYLRIGSAN